MKTLNFDPFNFTDPCEPDCSPERHAYHQGSWDMAVRICKHFKVGAYPGGFEEQPPSNSKSEDTSLDDKEKCNKHVYWWDGEYDGDCELPKGHLEPFHYDGVSYFDDDNNNRDFEQKNFETLLAQQQAKLLQVIEDKVIGEDEPPPPLGSIAKVLGRNRLRAEQRQALNKIKDNVINGGSL